MEELKLRNSVESQGKVTCINCTAIAIRESMKEPLNAIRFYLNTLVDDTMEVSHIELKRLIHLKKFFEEGTGSRLGSC